MLIKSSAESGLETKGRRTADSVFSALSNYAKSSDDMSCSLAINEIERIQFISVSSRQSVGLGQRERRHDVVCLSSFSLSWDRCRGRGGRGKERREGGQKFEGVHYVALCSSLCRGRGAEVVRSDMRMATKLRRGYRNRVLFEIE